MTVCAMFGCKNRMHKGCGKHFFRFPLKDPKRLLKWIEAVQRDDWKPSVHSKVCSDHFTEKDYMIRPGAVCPYLRTDAVPTPLFILRKKKTNKRKYTKKSTVSKEVEGESQGEGNEGAAAPTKETQEPPKESQTSEVDSQSRERAAETQDKEAGADKQGAKMDSHEKRPEARSHGGQEAAETQSQERIESRGDPTAEEPGKLVEMRVEQPPRDRIAEMDINDLTTQNERQVALILAELEDTHCEMRAAEARAAREAAIHHNPSPGDDVADVPASSDNQSSSESPADHIPFDHAYTPLTMNDKENNVPAPAPAPAPSPVVNTKMIKLRKKIKTLQKQVLRQGVKIKSLHQILQELRRNNQSEKDPGRVISEHCSGLALALFTTQLKNHKKYSTTQYCKPLKDFAQNLYHASPKAYKFCRLFLALPHPVSLRHWKTAIEGSQEAPQEAVMPGQATEQVDLSQEDILAGALKAVALESESSHEQELQNEDLSATQAQ